MNNSAPLFIIGAGFNLGANYIVGNNSNGYTYPLVRDLREQCFGNNTDTLKSIETLFDDAIRQRNFDPIRKMSERLMGADHYTASALIERPCAYHDFLKRFDQSHFLSFNYDALIEILLFKLNRWLPHNGYGVSVNAVQDPNVNNRKSGDSSNMVLHLHGSLYITTGDFDIIGGMIELKANPDFYFNPDSNATIFHPYEKIVHHGYNPSDKQIIAPIPDKSEGLNEAFVKATYEKTVDLIKGSDTIISIGYSYNLNDNSSYKRLLETAVESKSNLVIIDPSADEICNRLRNKYIALSVKSLNKTFMQWAGNNFNLIE